MTIYREEIPTFISSFNGVYNKVGSNLNQIVWYLNKIACPIQSFLRSLWELSLTKAKVLKDKGENDTEVEKKQSSIVFPLCNNEITSL